MNEQQWKEFLVKLLEALHEVKAYLLATRKVLNDQNLISRDEFDALVEEIRTQAHPLNEMDLDSLFGSGPPGFDQET